jgi:hypothetical protein
MIMMLNAALAIDRDTRTLTIGHVVEIDATGVIRRRIALAVASGELRMVGGSAVAVVITRDGKEVVPEPAPSKPQRWMKAAEANELLADALTYYSRGEWFDVYKSVECLEALSNYQDLLSEAGVSKGDVTSLTHTANSLYRHRKGAFDPPENPMTLKEAQHLIGRLLRVALDRSG